jgi:hypothetical protein
VIFCGPAQKITIRLGANEATSVSACEALLAFLSPKDVCGLQVSFLESVVEIRFLTRQGKADALTGIARLIAPTAFICTENTTIVHAMTSSRVDLMFERGAWESALRFQPGRPGEMKNTAAPENDPARSASDRPRQVGKARQGGA